MKAHEKFLELLAGDMTEEERLIICGFSGDPNAVEKTAWRPRPWFPGREVPLGTECNGYVTAASFRRAEDRTFRRRNALFGAGRALMIDDVGTKVPDTVLARLRPSALIETSPANYQAWYFLSDPIRDAARYDAIIRAFIAQELLGDDPGMSGVTRVGRLPDFINGKPKYGGRFVVRERYIDDRRYASAEIVEAFGLNLIGRRRALAGESRLLPEDVETRMTGYIEARRTLNRYGMLKRERSDAGGWTEIQCPWTGDHTDRADNGAAISEPNPENGYYGGFQCHHGHCLEKTWPDLTEWIAERAAEELEMRNEKA